MTSNSTVVTFNHFAELMRALEIALRIGGERHYRPYIEWRGNEFYGVNRYACVGWKFRVLKSEHRITVSYKAARLLYDWLSRSRQFDPEKDHIVFQKVGMLKVEIVVKHDPIYKIPCRAPVSFSMHPATGNSGLLTALQKLRTNPNYRRFIIPARKFSRQLMDEMKSSKNRQNSWVGIVPRENDLMLIPQGMAERNAVICDLGSARKLITEACFEDDVITISVAGQSDPVIIEAGDSIGIVAPRLVG